MEANSFWRKLINYETVSYFIAGILTTLVDYLVFALVNEFLKRQALVRDPAVFAAAAGWAAAVAFAFAVNKLAVFRSFDLSPGVLAREAAAFVGARAVSGLITVAFIWLTVSVLGWNEYLSKVLSSVFSLVFNYVASKLFIFKK